ncbi:hypothetical protein STVIR_2230 [Streptomyces viridochromogenes Tue57]|uniref:Uncharacterized protein n=1 Tax=Streptomyces viridochromogenes Tue57 TaxID=1160705 RepID=L8PKR4_STRVR|nr:hypothetical protein STVIR_2230 [Streptomyces viridochromogenes Tue57]
MAGKRRQGPRGERRTPRASLVERDAPDDVRDGLSP